MRIWFVVGMVLAIAACGDDEAEPAANGSAGSGATAGTGGSATVLASATIAPKSGNTTLEGTAKFSGSPGAISVTVSVKGAPPGEHGVHIHETGDCSAADATSAGGHWNPMMAHMHGTPGATSHIGDLGNMTVAADGMGTLTLVNSAWAIGSPDTSPVGKAIIVHEKKDDLMTQPTGDAGGRIGCGVIM
jgi:superoxide dismutase, Cu-Zn family